MIFWNGLCGKLNEDAGGLHKFFLLETRENNRNLS